MTVKIYRFIYDVIVPIKYCLHTPVNMGTFLHCTKRLILRQLLRKVPEILIGEIVGQSEKIYKV